MQTVYVEISFPVDPNTLEVAKILTKRSENTSASKLTGSQQDNREENSKLTRFTFNGKMRSDKGDKEVEKISL